MSKIGTAVAELQNDDLRPGNNLSPDAQMLKALHDATVQEYHPSQLEWRITDLEDAIYFLERTEADLTPYGKQLAECTTRIVKLAQKPQKAE